MYHAFSTLDKITCVLCASSSATSDCSVHLNTFLPRNVKCTLLKPDKLNMLVFLAKNLLIVTAVIYNLICNPRAHDDIIAITIMSSCALV